MRSVGDAPSNGRTLEDARQKQTEILVALAPANISPDDVWKLRLCRLEIDDQLEFLASSIQGRKAAAQQLRCRSTKMPQSVFKTTWLLSTCVWEEIRVSGQVAKLAAAGSFGIALLGLYFIFNSTSTQLSLSACAMYIVGTVVGVLLMQSNKWVARHLGYRQKVLNLSGASSV
jgi:hypothetical protein